MNNYSQEYIVSIAVVIVGILQAFGIVIDQNVIVGLIVGILGIWSAIRRYQKKDITLLGKRI